MSNNRHVLLFNLVSFPPLTRCLCSTSRKVLSQSIPCLRTFISPETCRRPATKPIFQTSLRPVSGTPKQKRAKLLLYATYVSGAIGFVLWCAIAYRSYGRFKMSARGIEELDVPLYGRRNKVFCRYRGYVLNRDLVNTVINEVPWFEVRPDDVWVLSYPKAGTTWLQEIVYLISTNFDYETAADVNLDERFPYLEYPFPGIQLIAEMPSPRFIKSHLPFSLLPLQLEEKKPKILYIARNPKDTAVSLFHFTNSLNFITFNGNMDDFAQLFVDGIAMYGPWTKHVQEAWERKDDDNVFFLFYEDLHKDFRGTVKEVAHFLGRPLSEAELDQLQDHCSFRSMQHNDRVNYVWEEKLGIMKEDGKFMRKGEVGDWKNHLSPETSAKFDTMAAKLEPLGLQFVDLL